MSEETFGDRLRRLLTAANVRSGELAKALDVSPEAVSRWLGGDRLPRSHYLARMAEVLGVSIADLVQAPASGAINSFALSTPEEPAAEWQQLHPEERRAVNEIVRLFARRR